MWTNEIKIKPIKFKIGDEILIKKHPVFSYGETTKLFKVYSGLFVIHERIVTNMYNIWDTNNKIAIPYKVSEPKVYIRQTTESTLNIVL